MYSLSGLGSMIADRTRSDAYAEALRRTVRPGAIVLDIGAGTGFMTVLACRLGARHVYAVEPSDASQLILPTARDNGCADRITVLQDRSTQLELAERADVMVSDLRGVLPPFHTHLSDIVDARTRLLKPGGSQIPARDRLFVAVVSAKDVLDHGRAIWQSAPYALDLSAAVRYASHGWVKHYAERDALLSEPECWAELDYTTLTEPHVKGDATLTATRAGVAHGLLAWFDAVLLDEVGYSNAPGGPRTIYGQAFYPLLEPLSLVPGDSVRVELRADPAGQQYRWSWRTEHRRAGAPGQVAQRFQQSDFLASPLSQRTLRRRAEDFAPALSRDGALTLRALELMRAGSTLGAIAAELYTAASQRFKGVDEALEFVADVSEQHAL